MPIVSAEKEYAQALIEFTRPDCDRFDFIRRFLAAAGLPSGVIPAGKDRFIHVAPAPKAGGPGLVSRPIFTAHIDRAPGTPGANDNSAAVLALLFFAAGRGRAGAAPPCEALFTDGEETAGSPSPRSQSSFHLGETLRKRKFSARVFYNLDMCGRGDTIILSEAGERLLESRRKTRTDLYRQLHALRTLALDKLTPVFPGRLMSLPTPFSDNLGFLLQGFPVLQITLLPRREALAYRREYRELTEEIAGRKRRSPESAAVYRKRFAEIQPETWKLRHTPADAIATLSPQAFALMQRLLEGLLAAGVPEL